MATEEDIVAMVTSSNSYLDVDENTIECSFHSLEVVNATFVRMGKKIPIPLLSKVTKTRVKQTIGKGARAGYRLRIFLQRTLKVVLVIMKHDRYGFGYKPNTKN